MKYVVGIDLGTSSVKLALVSNAGVLAKECQREYEPTRPHPGWKEIDPALWWDATFDGLRELLSGGPVDVACIGVTGQMHTTVFLDARGNSIRPAIMWNDSRTSDMVGRARRTLEDIGEKYLSQIISCGSPALNLLWLKENEAENYHRLYKFLIGPDWLVHQMTGSYLGTDYCEASTSSLFNLSKKKWSYAAIDALGLSRALLPNVRSSAEIAGTLHDEYAKALGLSRGIPVIVGTGDNPASALATGCLQNNLPVLSLGTSGVLMFTRPHFDPAFKGKNIQVSLQGNDVINLVQGTVQACGLSFSWWNKSILMRDSFDEVESEITAEFEQSPTRKPLIYYPHISGEKTIYGDASLTGAFIGLTSDVTRAQMTLAVMEGVAFGVCQLAEEMQVSLTDFDALKVIGGGSKSDTWMRVLSSVLNVTTVRSESYASASFGAALLALSALRGNSSLVQRNLPVDTMQQFHPNEGLLRHYESVYSKFLRVHDAIKLVLGDRSEVSS